MRVRISTIIFLGFFAEEDHSHSLPPAIRDYHRTVRERLMQAQKVLKGMLMYARDGFGEAKKERVNLNEMLQEIKNSLDDKSGIVFHVAQGLPTFVTERVPLQQVFTNLLVNACRHHDKMNGIVKVYYNETGECYQFFVEDDGPGISKIYHQKIFTIFQTLNERQDSDHLGVGLAIVKKILDDRQLEINIFSAPGGSIFSFTWPKA
jgi:light-regulated signal transduction histidine kinase (bacteriophytochrome)